MLLYKKQLLKRGKSKHRLSEETYFFEFEIVSESHGEVYDRTTSKKSVNNGKAPAKYMGKKAVPQLSESPLPRGNRRKNATVSPL